MACQLPSSQEVWRKNRWSFSYCTLVCTEQSFFVEKNKLHKLLPSQVIVRFSTKKKTSIFLWCQIDIQIICNLFWSDAKQRFCFTGSIHPFLAPIQSIHAISKVCSKSTESSILQCLPIMFEQIHTLSLEPLIVLSSITLVGFFLTESSKVLFSFPLNPCLKPDSTNLLILFLILRKFQGK